jgi:hypothetical protein
LRRACLNGARSADGVRGYRAMGGETGPLDGHMAASVGAANTPGHHLRMSAENPGNRSGHCKTVGFAFDGRIHHLPPPTKTARRAALEF